VIGDGSFFMSLSSLESIASLDVPVVVVVLDNGGFGSQREKQHEAYGGRTVGVDYDNPDIVAIGNALGIASRWITSGDDVEEACAGLAGRKHGALLAVRRTTASEVTWYEGSARRRCDRSVSRPGAAASRGRRRGPSWSTRGVAA
jgi:thiamine pyrophosphate-dependent acetolactate synthase large subunit-like protein